jgi:RNA polymerase primary sigma factor
MKQIKITARVTNRDVQSFNQYLKDISEIDRFTPEEEKACTEKVFRGDEDAIAELVRRNLRFVVSVAKQYANAQNPLEDLVNEGNIGLIKAAKRFKPDMKFKFISYAVYWIRKVIIEHISNHGRMVRLPANKINGLSKLDKQMHELEQKLGRQVSINDVIDEFGGEIPNTDLVTKKSEFKKFSEEYNFLSALNGYSMDSLDRNIGDVEDGVSLSDTLSDESIFKATDHDIINQDIKNGLDKVLNTLKPRDKQIMIALFGLDGTIPRTLKDIGDEMGITREMVRQIKEKSLIKLKNQLQNSELKF